jgi:DNA repair exonuclease SbcCD nuclease subunit
MGRILLFSDAHISQHKKSFARLQDCLNCLEWVFQTAQKNNIQDIVFGGDLFQDRSKIDVIVYHLTFNLISKYCNKNNRLWLLLGNHDLWFMDKWDISSVQPLSAIEGVTVIDKPCTLQVSNSLIDFLPYTTTPIEHLDKLTGKQTLVAHLAVNGAQLNVMHNTRADIAVEHDGEMTIVGAEAFKDWKQVFLGHYHSAQKIADNAEYIGSTLQLNFGEAFQHKHIIIYDTDSGAKEYIKNTISPQHLIIPEEDVGKYDIENNFVRLSVDVAADLVKLKQDLEELKPGTLEFLPVMQKDSEHVVKDAKAIFMDEEKMLENYIKQVDIGDMDEKHLLEMGKNICEATKI